jgi:hypothetical protein
MLSDVYSSKNMLFLNMLFAAVVPRYLKFKTFYLIVCQILSFWNSFILFFSRMFAILVVSFLISFSHT